MAAEAPEDKNYNSILKNYSTSYGKNIAYNGIYQNQETCKGGAPGHTNQLGLPATLKSLKLLSKLNLPPMEQRSFLYDFKQRVNRVPKINFRSKPEEFSKFHSIKQNDNLNSYFNKKKMHARGSSWLDARYRSIDLASSSGGGFQTKTTDMSPNDKIQRVSQNLSQ